MARKRGAVAGMRSRVQGGGDDQEELQPPRPIGGGMAGMSSIAGGDKGGDESFEPTCWEEGPACSDGVEYWKMVGR